VPDTFPYREDDPDAFTRLLIGNLIANPSFVTGCFVVSHRHGFTMEIEYVQRPDGTGRYRTWSDVQGQISSEARELQLDVPSVLDYLQRERPPQGGAFGEVGTAVVVIATNSPDRSEGTWRVFRVPERGESLGDSPLDQLLAIVYRP
jgi:hypothetical protein